MKLKKKNFYYGFYCLTKEDIKSICYVLNINELLLLDKKIAWIKFFIDGYIQAFDIDNNEIIYYNDFVNNKIKINFIKRGILKDFSANFFK